MKRKLAISVISLLIFTGAFAQELANFAGREPLISPEIKDKEITFRVLAPYAATVRLSGSWMSNNSSVEMTKNEKGIWTVTIQAPAPELYTYSFNVDGLSI